MNNENNSAFPTPQTQLNQDANGLTKREYMATLLTAAVISGAVARGVPSRDWWDAPFDGVRLADKLLLELAKT